MLLKGVWCCLGRTLHSYDAIRLELVVAPWIMTKYALTRGVPAVLDHGILCHADFIHNVLAIDLDATLATSVLGFQRRKLAERDVTLGQARVRVPAGIVTAFQHAANREPLAHECRCFMGPK